MLKTVVTFELMKLKLFKSALLALLFSLLSCWIWHRCSIRNVCLHFYGYALVVSSQDIDLKSIEFDNPTIVSIQVFNPGFRHVRIIGIEET